MKAKNKEILINHFQLLIFGIGIMVSILLIVISVLKFLTTPLFKYRILWLIVIGLSFPVLNITFWCVRKLEVYKDKNKKVNNDVS